MAPLLSAADLSFHFPRAAAPVFADVCLTVSASECVAIHGSNGCGKSSLLHCLCGVIPRIIKGTLNGRVELDGTDTTSMRLPRIAASVGLVFQHADRQLLCATVRDEIAFGPENLCVPADDIQRRCATLADALGLTTLLDADPLLLSGGEQQRVALAAVLAMEPRVLLLDEPFTHLDPDGRTRALALLHKHIEGGSAIVTASPARLEWLDLPARELSLSPEGLSPLDATP